MAARAETQATEAAAAATAAATAAAEADAAAEDAAAEAREAEMESEKAAEEAATAKAAKHRDAEKSTEAVEETSTFAAKQVNNHSWCCECFSRWLVPSNVRREEKRQSTPLLLLSRSMSYKFVCLCAIERDKRRRRVLIFGCTYVSRLSAWAVLLYVVLLHADCACA